MMGKCFIQKKGLENPGLCGTIKSKKEGMIMKVQIDESRCIGCGMCAAAVPGVFRIVGRVSTVLAQPEKAQEAKTFDAAGGCPVNAICVGR